MPPKTTWPYKFIGFGAIDVTKPYKFIGFGPKCTRVAGISWTWACPSPTRVPDVGARVRDMALLRYRCLRDDRRARPCALIGFGAMDVAKPYKFIWFGGMYGPKPYEFIGSRAPIISHTTVARSWSASRPDCTACGPQGCSGAALLLYRGLVGHQTRAGPIATEGPPLEIACLSPLLSQFF